MSFTDTAVRQSKPQEKGYRINDADGLSLFVAAKGKKSWRFRFTLHGEQSRYSFGVYLALSLRDARTV